MTVKTQKTVKILAQYIWGGGGWPPQAPDTRRLWQRDCDRQTSHCKLWKRDRY